MLWNLIIGQGLKRSDVWNHFTKVNENYISCHICKMIFKYRKNTTNIKEHVKCRHPAYFQPTSLARLGNERFVESNDETLPTSISSNDNMVNANVTEPPTKCPKQLWLYSASRINELFQEKDSVWIKL